MPITRTFLDWKQPALPAVVQYLLSRYARNGTLDLGRVVLVLPGGRAGRRLLELLVQRAESDSLVFFPPEIRTVGKLPELLYEPKRQFASDLVQQLAWIQAIQTIARQRTSPHLPLLPAEDDFAGWMNLARLFARQHRELAADALDFQNVVEQGPKVAGFQESDRWRLLSDIQQEYLTTIDNLGLWDLQTARLVAIRNRECETDRDIVLVATADMNGTMRAMLDQASEHVTALIHAPETIADRFDKHGCLDPKKWTDARIDIESRQIQVVEGPDQQAEVTRETIASYDARYRSDQIVVGVLDDRLVPYLQRRLMQAGVAARWVVGRTLPETTPYRLLEALADYVQRPRFTEFASLVRHPDVHDWIEARKVPGDWLTGLDQYHNEHLQPMVGQWLGERSKHGTLKRIAGMIHKAIAPLLDDARPVHRWCPMIAETLLAFYQNRVLDPDNPHEFYTLKSLDAIRSTLLSQQQIPAGIAPTLTAHQAIELTLEQLRAEQIAPPSNEDAIELLGWLELPLDTAPALIVTSLNEGFVPTSVNSDLFLPNALRRQLGLLDNTRRYARDAYALSAIAASRSELTLLVARHTGNNDPLAPSRLLLATDDATMAQRALEFFGDGESSDSNNAADSPTPKVHVASPKSALFVPKPRPLDEPIKAISVTAFRGYLACPYRFYLRHVLHLRPLEDTVQELDAAAFGSMIHAVLGEFGSAPIRSSTDEQQIRRFLSGALDQYVTAIHGPNRLPAVDIQIAQARARLDALAAWQARWADEGWEIKHVETSGGEEPYTLPSESAQPLTLHGRIDRIDHNQRTGQWAVFDYKTGDTPKSPKETHLKSGEWIDLQLPLYRRLITTLDIPDDVMLGYIVLPRDVSKVGNLMAEWDAEQLKEADKKADEVAKDVAQGKFWPPAIPPPNILTDFAVICQDHAFRPRFEGSP